jgi:4-hydroxy-3-polyprenylbenzoate decarboxylase
VTLKERRKMVLAVRESPLNAIHLENMLKLARLGVVIIPPVLGFYTSPKSLEDIVNYIVGKALDQFGIEHDLFKRWRS